MMKVIPFALAALFSLNLYAQPLMLVSEEEMKASAAIGGLPTPRSTPQPGAPRIELLSPDIKKPVNVPTKIYGAFKIDITQRLLGVAKVTKDGIQVTDASLPSGKHQLLLSLTDTLGRESQQVISFIVP
ncbi:MAG: hypothetical protein EBV34_16505 [Betaproteobacteria bacterium]|nr:hypothetical protein [Betaproteobacteria bacterium]